jgi:NADPH-dependent ferric siderophore reductase
MRIPTYTVSVLGSRSLSPRMRRVTLGGAELRGFQTRGEADERVKLLLPARDGDRPVSRTLTVRRFDPDALELDIDIALHDGPAASWSLSAEEGEEVGIMGATGGYDLDAGPSHHLLVGDEAALPAIATILERLAEDARADVFLEAGDPSAELALDTAAGAEISWLHRGGNGSRPGDLLVEAVRSFDWPSTPVRVWAAGESFAMRAIRRHVRDELGVPHELHRVVGYWRERLTEDQAIERHLEAQRAARERGASEDEIHDAGLY